MNASDIAEDFMLIHDLGRERLPALSFGLPPNLLLFFLPVRGWPKVLVPDVYTLPAAILFVLQKPGRRPPHITDRSVSAVRRRWVGAINDLATSKFHDAVDEFFERSLWSTRNLAAFHVQGMLENF